MNGTEVNPRYSESALKEKAFLQELNKKPPGLRSLPGRGPESPR